jgi:pimeloyl-ACP methyl ester carboxylesterase
MHLPTREWSQVGERRALLVHGLNGTGQTWWRVAGSLVAEGWHVTTVDLRGHGAADPGDDLALASYAADLPRGDWDLVVGHSLGGAASVLASVEPGFTRSLAIIDPGLAITPADRAAIIDDQVAELELTEQSLATSKPHWHSLDVAHKVAGVRLSSPRTARGSFDDNPEWNVVASAAALPVPTLIISGDPLVYSMLAPSTALAIIAANPLVTYEVVAGTGHSPFRDDFDATMAVLYEWLADVAG